MTAHPPEGYYPQQPYYAPGWQAPAQPAPAPRDRRRLYRVLAVVGGLVLLAVVAGLVLGIRYFLDVRPLGTVSEARTATARQLDVGHCIAELPDDGPVTRVRVVPCADPHAAEVVGALDLRDDAWPGQNRVDRQAVAYCEMDTAQREAGFRPVTWAPTQTAWGQGDRRALCLAWLDDGTAKGSFTAGDQVEPS